VNWLARVALKALVPALLVAFAAPHAAMAATPGAPPSWQVTLADSTEPGKPLVIEGRVLSWPDSQPVRDVTVHVWHADAHGIYGNPPGGRFARLDGKARTNVAGGFRVLTVLPGPAEGAAHIHYALSGTGLDLFAGTLNLARSHGAGSDTAYAKVPYMLNPTASQQWLFVEPDEKGFHGSCRLYVRRHVTP
jgi:protocatechuate 3,4-dioxygenase beta subunit